ncbi:hypothetical protein F4782DRAFT_127366 [Xylaria castorea]|nr:hypothetical protein F4782DRAFT_127366 [Xylaria castorea]
MRSSKDSSLRTGSSKRSSTKSTSAGKSSSVGYAPSTGYPSTDYAPYRGYASTSHAPSGGYASATGYAPPGGYSSSGAHTSSTGHASSSGKSLSKGTSTPKGNTASTGKTCEWQRLEIIVFSGSPVDAPQYRHTGLLIQDLARDNTILNRRYLNVIGTAGLFEREESSRNPKKSALFIGAVHVATIRARGLSLRNAIWSTPVNNADRSWNCQNYVGDALECCTREGLISEGQMDYGIDGMVDFVHQAQEEA